MKKITILFSCVLSLIVLTLVPVRAQGSHDYFDLLSSQPEVLMARGYRSNAEIDRDSQQLTGGNPRVEYDSAVDAARVTIPANSASLPNQVRPYLDGSGSSYDHSLPTFPAIKTGTLLFTWDARWESAYLDLPSQGVISHKEFQISRSTRDDQRRIEVRTRYGQSDSTYVGNVDLRSYVLDHAGDSQPMGRGGCNPDCQLNSFEVQPETWTRYWAFLDFDSDEFTFWVADEHTAPIVLFDRFPVNISADGIDHFWFEYNTSQDRIGPDMFSWFRNFVVLQNVSRASVQNFVNQGSPESELVPSPPANLLVQ